MIVYKTVWTGSFPNLCRGEWKLYANGVQLDTDIPFQGEPANTYGVYEECYIGNDWHSVYEEYEDGLSSNEWIETYSSWLDTIDSSEEGKKAIFEAFRENDWRESSCGGCI